MCHRSATDPEHARRRPRRAAPGVSEQPTSLEVLGDVGDDAIDVTLELFRAAAVTDRAAMLADHLHVLTRHPSRRHCTSRALLGG